MIQTACLMTCVALRRVLLTAIEPLAWYANIVGVEPKILVPNDVESPEGLFKAILLRLIDLDSTDFESIEVLTAMRYIGTPEEMDDVGFYQYYLRFPDHIKHRLFGERFVKFCDSNFFRTHGRKLGATASKQEVLQAYQLWVPDFYPVVSPE